MKNNPMSRPLYEADPQIASAIDNEVRRQHEGLELIASENFVSEAVLEAMGSVFTNKYAEGYPGKRYYGGCEFADVVEELARERAKKLFGAEHANVQPHADWMVTCPRGSSHCTCTPTDSRRSRTLVASR